MNKLSKIVIGFISLVASFISTNLTNVLIANIYHCTTGFDIPSLKPVYCPLITGYLVFIVWAVYFVIWFLLIKFLTRKIRSEHE